MYTSATTLTIDHYAVSNLWYNGGSLILNTGATTTWTDVTLLNTWAGAALNSWDRTNLLWAYEQHTRDVEADLELERVHRQITQQPITVVNREADGVWQRWNGEYFEQVVSAAMTEDQQREWRARNEQRIAAQRAAADRAKELFLSWLTPEQRASFEREAHFDVHSPSGRRYRVYAGEQHGRHGNIAELDEKGTVLASICCAPSGDIPHFDAIVGQRVALEWDEAEFRRRANFTPRVPNYRREVA